MKLYDCSRVISSEMALYPGNRPPVRLWTRRMDEGGHNNVSRIELGSHTGTHVDAPFHFVADGKTLDDVPLDAFVGPCRLIELMGVPVVTEAGLRSYAPQKGEILLIKTDNSLRDPRAPFDPHYVGLSLDAARYLVQCGVRTVGVDELSVEDASDAVIHRPLLEAGMGILEGLDLRGVSAGKYFLFAAPIRVQGAEGAPCRAVLVDFEDE